MSRFRTPEVSREQLVLWSQRLDDALPADHPARLLDLLLRSSAFAATFAAWESEYCLLEGQPPYHPRELAALYLHGLLNRLRSSRQLEAACWNRLDVVWLLSGQKPDHSTIAAFVSKNGARLKELNRAVLRIGVQAGLVRLEHASVDGSKHEADAGRGSVHSKESIERQVARLDEYLASLEAEWSANEQKELALGDEAPWAPSSKATLAQRMQRLAQKKTRLNEALAVIERRRLEAEQAGTTAPKAIASTVDPDSRLMRDKEGRRKPNYNSQIAVDTTQGMIVAETVNDRAEDSGQLTPVLAEIRANCGHLPAEVSADSQYNTGAELARLEALGVTGLLPEVHTRDGVRSGAATPRGGVCESDPLTSDSAAVQDEPTLTPVARDALAAAQQEALAAAQRGATLSDGQMRALPRDAQGHLRKDAFVYDRERNEYRCPAGQALPLLRTSREPSRDGPLRRRQYRCGACAVCPHAAFCCRNPDRGRIVNRDEYEDHRERMRARMATPAARDRYRLRKQTVEPRIGYLKQTLGLRRFLRRGLERVRAEWTLACTAVNIGVLLRCWQDVRPVL